MDTLAGFLLFLAAGLGWSYIIATEGFEKRWGDGKSYTLLAIGYVLFWSLFMISK